MKKIYCISGLGSDEKIFAKIKVEGYELVHISWLTPQKNEPIESYAKRMSNGITGTHPVIMGLSFGGMMAIEIAKWVPVSKLILISSIKSSHEMPLWMRAAGRLLLNKLITLHPHRILEPIENFFIGVTSEEEKQMVRRYRQLVDPAYLSWAINAILNWKNDRKPGHLYHIHGDKDRIFPLNRIKPDYIIPGGGHLMIFNHSREVNKLLKRILDS